MDWSSIRRILIVGGYCSDFWVIRACLSRIPHLYHSFDLPFSCLIMHTSSGAGRSFALRIGGRSVEESAIGRTGGETGSIAIVVYGAPFAGPLITTQIVLFHTLNTPGFEHVLHSNQDN